MKKTRNESKKRPLWRRILRSVGAVLLALILLLSCGVAFLTIAEYRPADRETVTVEGTAAAAAPAPGDTLTVLTWNIGYGALGQEADFFMDGGKSVRGTSKAVVEDNMQGILAKIQSYAPDIVFLQEADLKSSRSYRVDELALLRGGLTGYASSFAYNYKVSYVPYPLPTLGKVEAGLVTFSSFPTSGADRVQLPVPFSWPVRTVNLKRCLLVSRIPLAGSDKELVLVNLHLEAYDDGEGKLAQTKMLAELLTAEAAKGNYVVAGGDFNQIFSSADVNAYPAKEGMWQPGEIGVTQFEGVWQFLMDAAVPSCRSLDQPYVGADKTNFQYYLIDGFIVSGNITVTSCQTQDLGFVNSDHNPVLLQLTLQ